VLHLRVLRSFFEACAFLRSPSAQGGRNGTRDGVTRRLGAQALYAVWESVVRYAGRNEARRTLGQGENGYGKRCAYNGLLASFLEGACVASVPFGIRRQEWDKGGVTHWVGCKVPYPVRGSTA